MQNERPDPICFRFNFSEDWFVSSQCFEQYGMLKNAYKHDHMSGLNEYN